MAKAKRVYIYGHVTQAEEDYWDSMGWSTQERQEKYLFGILRRENKDLSASELVAKLKWKFAERLVITKGHIKDLLIGV